ncbi:MAG: FtsX-like permease family protein [Candidatus Promineifilaceae bacterium]
MTMQLTLAMRYLWGRKVRTLLTTLAVMFGVMVIFGLNGVLPAFSLAFRQNMLAAADQVDLAISSTSRGTFAEESLDSVTGTGGIAHATGILRHNVSLPDGSAVSAATVAGIDPATANDVRAFDLVDGRFLRSDDGNTMLIGETLAQQSGLTVGDTLVLPAAQGTTGFEIVGILTARGVPGVEEVYVPLAAAQTLFNEPDRLNTIEAIFAPNVDQEAVRADIQARLGDAFKLGELEVGQELMANLSVGQTAMNFFGFMSLAMGGFIIFNTFRTVVAERRRDIGLLRAIGASRRTILSLILVESVVQGVIGTVLGMIAGYLFVSLMLLAVKPIFEEFLRFSVGGPQYSAGVIIGSIILGVGVTVASGLFPALSASRVTPLEALRPAVAEVQARRLGRATIVGVVLMLIAAAGLLSGNAGLALLGAVLFLIGLILVAPALIHPIARVFGGLFALIFAREGHLAQGNLTRQPGRSAITASTMMIGLAILLAMVGMVSSIYTGFMAYIDKSMGADFLLMPNAIILSGGNVGAGPELIQAVKDTPGIENVASLRLAPSVANGFDIQLIGIDPLVYGQVAGLQFSQGEDAAAYSALAGGQTIIVNGIFASQNQVSVGDVLTMKTPEGNRQYEVVGIGTDYLNAKLATGYISQTDLATDFHQTSDLLLMANLTDGADAAAVEADLNALVAQYPAFGLFSSAEWRETQETTFASTMSFLYILMIALAFPSLIALINTLVINVLERTREIGMLRAVGGTQKQVRRMILVESLLLAATGTAFGILGGIWLGYGLVGAMNFAGYIIPYSFPYVGILVAIAVGLLFGVVASVLPARQAAKLDIVTALRYE